MKTFLYALKCPFSGKIRYIGKSDDPYGRRLRHCTTRAMTHKWCWIESLRRQGKKPVLEILCSVNKSDWQFWERKFIAGFKQAGLDLVNGTEGGDGVVPTPETREKMGRANRGRKASVSTREKLRVAHLGQSRPCSEETKQKMREKALGRRHTPETIAKLSVIQSNRDWGRGCPRNRKEVYATV